MDTSLNASTRGRRSKDTKHKKWKHTECCLCDIPYRHNMPKESLSHRGLSPIRPSTCLTLHSCCNSMHTRNTGGAISLYGMVNRLRHFAELVKIKNQECPTCVWMESSPSKLFITSFVVKNVNNKVQHNMHSGTVEKRHWHGNCFFTRATKSNHLFGVADPWPSHSCFATAPHTSLANKKNTPTASLFDNDLALHASDDRCII